MHKLYLLTNLRAAILRAPDDPPAPPPAPPAPSEPPPATPAPPAGAWYDSHPDENVRTFLSEQQIGDANVAATKLFHANKALGGSTDVIVKPGADATPEQRAAFLDALGRPKEASAYDFGLPADAPVDEGFKTWAQTTFHEAGLSADQAKAVVGKWQEFVTEHTKNATAALQVAEDTAIADLKKEHGAQFDAFITDGQKAFGALGLDKAIHDKIAATAGSAAYLTMMAALGKKMGGEAAFKGSQGGQGETDVSAMTPEQAKAEIAKLQGDAEFQAKYTNNRHPEHAVALKRMERLFERAEPPPVR